MHRTPRSYNRVLDEGLIRELLCSLAVATRFAVWPPIYWQR
jgi:hypothetical protein